MSGYLVTPETIRTVAAQVASGAGEIDAQRQTLLSQIQSLGDSWQGTAESALQSLYAQWDTEVRALHNTLVEIGQQLQAAATSYETANENVRVNFAGQ